MKTIDTNILSFLGEIILTYKLEKGIIDKKFDYSKNSNKLESAFSLFYNDEVMKRIDERKDPADFCPIIKLKLIIDKLINNEIFYEDLSFLIKDEFEVSLLLASEISSSIKNNKDIKNLKDSEDKEEYLEENESSFKEKTIGYELLK
jgi:hypothetical protein